MGIPKTRGRGGPQTAAGKAACAGNALKSGIASTRWLQPGEQQEFEQRLAELHMEYPDAGASASILLARVARNLVKLNRLDGIEDGLHSAARLSTEQLTIQRVDNADGGFWPDTEDGRLQAKHVLCAAAMPDMHRLDLVARYQFMLERQISKLLDQVIRLCDRPKQPLRAAAAESSALSAATPGSARLTDIVDAQVKPAL